MTQAKFAVIALICCVSFTSETFGQRRRDEGQQNSEIIVEAPTHAAIDTFVRNFAATSQYAGEMARWDRHICPGVFGLAHDQGQAIVDRISQRAFQVGLGVERPGCRADIAIFVTPDASTLARTLVDGYGRYLARYHNEHIGTPGESALAEFRNGTAPVRWWHVALTASGSGFHLRESELAGSDQLSQLTPSSYWSPVAGTLPAAPRVRVPGSRLHRGVKQEFARVIIVVDARQAQGVTLNSLGDYLAMVALSQINPNHATSEFPSILNLFRSGNVSAMTEWDVSYLQGVYHMSRDASALHLQRSDIARTIDRDLRDRPAQRPQPHP